MIGSVLASQLQQICSVLELKPGPVCMRAFLSFHTRYARPLPPAPPPQVPELAQRRLSFPWAWGAGQQEGWASLQPTFFSHGMWAVGAQHRPELAAAARLGKGALQGPVDI